MNWFSGLLNDIRLRRVLSRPARLELEWKRRGGWLSQHLPQGGFMVSAFPQMLAIERRAAKTSQLGEFPLHERYGQPEAKRNSEAVRTSSDLGRLYRWLVVERKPEVVVEFGTAFGVFSMFWLSGLETNGRGELLTFEINKVWREIAAHNLSMIGHRFRSVAGAFEDKIDEVLGGRKIDLAFIDAIHTSAWVLPQYEQVVHRLNPGGLVALDDIDFSHDMRCAWDSLASDPRTLAAVAVRGHVGLIEVAGC
jgi:predicted O-methyltransferase YrrM